MPTADLATSAGDFGVYADVPSDRARNYALDSPEAMTYADAAVMPEVKAGQNLGNDTCCLSE